MAFELFATLTNSTTTVNFDFQTYRFRIVNNSDSRSDLYVNGSFQRTFELSAGAIIETSNQAYGIMQGNNQLRASGGTLRIEREVQNTAPTQPGVFTQPTGELEIGDTRTISWGASTDAEGDFSQYNLEESVNGGAWNILISTFLPSWSVTVPNATNVKYRVCGIDRNGSKSPYRESPTYTVTKPKYYWSKYNVAQVYSLVGRQIEDVTGDSYFTGVYADYAFNSSTGVITPVGKTISANWSDNSEFYTAFSPTSFFRFVKYSSVVGTWNRYTVESRSESKRGSLVQSGLIAEEGTYPMDGIHSDGYWYVRGSRVNQSIAPTGAFTAPTPTTTLKPNQGVTVAFTASTATNISLYELEYRYNSGLWTTVGTNNTALSRSFTPTTDKTLTNVQFRVRAKNTSNVYSDYVYSEFYNIEHNAKPTITLTTGNNLALSENANLAISGQAVDADNGNVLTVYYQINTGNTTALATGISNGTAPLPYTKTLQFKQGALYDGTTIVFNNMVGDQTYTLKVWAEDNQGGKSDVQSRLFTVIPNRAPILTVTAIEPASDKINNDTMTIAGTVTDPENQTITVKYKINNGELIQVYSGAGGNYTFNFKLGALRTGENLIEIQASDSYNLVTTVVKRFTKRFDAKNLLQSVARYKGTLPTAGVTGVVAWFERETGDLTINPTVSMRTAGQTESYEAMTLSNTAPINADITEDQYQKSVETAKTELVLKVSLDKTIATSTKGIKKITGALQ